MEYLKQVMFDFFGTVAEMSPYLLFGFFVAGVLSVFISQQFVERHLGGRGIWPLLKASLFGIPLPLCSCGVIPVAMSLHKHGASKGSAVSFLLSTPQTGADSIFVTLSLLGPVFAIFRPLAALVTGLVGGGLVSIFEKPDIEEQNNQTQCSDPCCSNNEKKIINGLKYGFITLPGDIGKAMLIGLLIAAGISALVPDGFFADKLGTGIVPMLVMMALGIPVYVCATASVPVAAALILKGLTPGAALVFLMTGPATNAAAFATIWKILGKATALTYLAAVAGCALLGGILLDYLAFDIKLDIANRAGWMLPQTIKYISTGLLLAILIFAMFTKQKKA